MKPDIILINICRRLYFDTTEEGLLSALTKRINDVRSLYIYIAGILKFDVTETISMASAENHIINRC